MIKRYISVLLAMLLAVGVKAQEDSIVTYPLLHKSSMDYADRIARLDYEGILEEIEEKRAKAKKRRKTLPELDPIENECKRCLQMLKSSDQVLILDSLVVDKNRLLLAYGFGGEVGAIVMSKDGSTTNFITERGNMSYRAEVAKGDDSGRLQLVSSYIENGQFVDTRPLKGIDMDGDANYPFMMSDGMTFYFAARTRDGLGNYDLYATRYDSETGIFYRPENMGFPFNSYANDYMMVIDEALGVGWFASDRYQPEDKVCVYTFVPNDSRNPLDYENEDNVFVRQKAMLCPIAVTWTPENEQVRIRARQRLSLMLNNGIGESAKSDFTLVINWFFSSLVTSSLKEPDLISRYFIRSF
jgi:hypothetical protein